MSRDDVRTVHLGQFTHEHAEAIAGELERAGIVWWYKAPGFLSQIWEYGVRLFVDRRRLDEARAIAERILAGQASGGGEVGPDGRSQGEGPSEEKASGSGAVGPSEAGGPDGPPQGEGPSDGEDHPEGEGSSSGQA